MSSPLSRSPGRSSAAATSRRPSSSTARAGGTKPRRGPRLEFPFTLLPGRGIRRSLAPRAILANLGAIVGLLWACLRAFVSFAFSRPRVVVIVGGYASFPAGVAALLTRVPLVSMTTDAVPGAVNGLLGRFAAANAVAFPGTELPRAHVTGTPVRSELASLDRTPEGQAAGRAALDLPPDRPTVAAFGGSLGARRINRAVADLARTWRGRSEGPRSLYHVTGRRDYEEFASSRTVPAPGPASRAPCITGSFPSRTTWPSSTPGRTSASPGPGP